MPSIKYKNALGEWITIPMNYIEETSGVPETRKINGKALSSDITLSASDVGQCPLQEP